jgi:Bacterial PH domain
VTPERLFFECSRAGAIGAGRQRLGGLFLALALAMLAATGWTWWSGHLLAGFLCLGVTLVVWTAWSLTANLDELRLEVDAGSSLLRIHTRSRAIELPLAGATGRRLDSAERDHLASLATLGGITLPTGGFESHRLGEFQLYASDLAHAVLIESGEERIILTPDDPEAFLAACTSGPSAPPVPR